VSRDLLLRRQVSETALEKTQESLQFSRGGHDYHLDMYKQEIVKPGINTECSICLTDTMEQPVVLEACQHAFCLACLQSWQRLNVAGAFKNCPLCRQAVKEKNAADSLLKKTHLMAV
jgi:hypothetical protein